MRRQVSNNLNCKNTGRKKTDFRLDESKTFCNAFLFMFPLFSISYSPSQLSEVLSPAVLPHAWRTTLIVNP